LWSVVLIVEVVVGRLVDVLVELPILKESVIGRGLGPLTMVAPLLVASKVWEQSPMVEFQGKTSVDALNVTGTYYYS
jgi:hypothetical protein